MPATFHTPVEVAEQLGLSREYVTTLCRRGVMGVVFRGEHYIHPDEVETLRLARAEQPPHPGRKKQTADYKLVIGLSEQGMTGGKIAKKLRMNRSRVYRYLAEHKLEQEIAGIRDVSPEATES